MHILRKLGSTSNILRTMLRNSSTGQGLTGLAYNTSGLIISTIADNEAAATAYTVAGTTIETIATLATFAAPTATKCRFKEVDATNHPGLYELQFADARFAVASAKCLRITITGAANLLDKEITVQLTSVDVDSATAFMTSLARVVDLTNLPAATTDWLTAAAVKADAVTKIQTGLAVDSTVAKAATALSNAVWTDAKAGYLTGAVALEATLTAIKGAGWSTETLAALDVLIDAIKAKTDNLPAAPASTGDVTTVGGKVDTVDTVVDAIKLKTDLIPAAPAAVGDVPTAAANAAAVLAATVDTLTVSKLLQALLAVLANKAAVSGDTISFKDVAGTTEVVSVTCGSTAGERTASTVT